jgi:hypothetical protein
MRCATVASQRLAGLFCRRYPEDTSAGGVGAEFSVFGMPRVLT